MQVLITLLFLAVFACAPARCAQQASVAAELVPVEVRPLNRIVKLPGELQAYQAIALYSKVTGFVTSVTVDRGSRVKTGDLLVEMAAPEIQARRAEAQARISALQAQRAEAQARLAAARSTLERLREAARTPGVVAGNDLVLAEKDVAAAEARVAALAESAAAAEAALTALAEMERYLRVEAPFHGVITERIAHPGSLAGPQSGDRHPLLRLQQIGRLRLVVPVPEAYLESVRQGKKVAFTVPAHPGRTFAGLVARPSYAVQRETRTMPVELDVDNRAGQLAPGMYAEVSWPVTRSQESLFVPATAVVATTERIFVIRVSGGLAEWVDVRRGLTVGDDVEVFGDLRPGDLVVRRGTDEIRPGARVSPP